LPRNESPDPKTPEPTFDGLVAAPDGGGELKWIAGGENR
jgi:hypothetical protein